MTLHYEDAGLRLFHGSNRDILPTLPDASYDSIVTDPPYELGFMGKGWDSSGIAYDVDVWRECFRVLKPGGHMLSFGGTRTWHRIAVAIEDAGFEIRDSIAWMYGSGFPKSLDVGKALSKSADPIKLREVKLWLADQFTASGKTKAQINRECGFTASDYLKTEPGNDAGGRATWHLLIPYGEKWVTLKKVVGFGDDYDEFVADYARVVGKRSASRGESSGIYGDYAGEVTEYAPTEAAQQWAGWGTALKPAFEPIIVARRPFPGTVAANVLAYGTGAINIDACRVPSSESTRRKRTATDFGMVNDDGWVPTPGENGSDSGRFPSNVLLEESQATALDAQAGTLTSGTGAVKRASSASRDGNRGAALGKESRPEGAEMVSYGDSGGASRYFPTFRYEAKAPGSERPSVDGVAHATVKPLDLMRWLVRLVTRPGGRVLDLFAGSGTTGEAALLEGMEVDLIELEADHLPLIMQRIKKPLQPSMFGDWEEEAS